MDNYNKGNQPNGGDNRNNGNDNQNNGKNNRGGHTFMIYAITSLIVLFFMTMMMNRFTEMSTEEITYSQFLEMVETDQVEAVEFDTYQINITPKETETGFYEQQINYYCGYINDEELLPLLKAEGVEISRAIPDNTSTWLYNILSMILPLALIWMLMGFLMKRMGGGAMGVGKSKAKVFNMERTTGVTFKDVAGQDEAKESLQEVVDFLNNPMKYRDIGAKLPKGALLVGPPGTGKTLLAKAVAGEAGVPFFSLAGSDFVEMFVGVGAARVRDLFQDAQKAAPCIIFIDEIDAIGKSRDSRFGGGNDEREQTLNQLLAEMDGFDTSKGLLILAATNRPEVLDKALLRPGRFDRRIIVDKPDLKGRLDTLKVHSKDVMMDETVDLDAIALATAGLVGSDLANMVNEAAICAVKKGRKYVNQADLFEAFELVAVGGKEKKDRVMSEQERKIVAYHEVGHAIVAALSKDTEPVQKITIVPRTMGALGYTLQTPEEEKYLQTKEELLAKIRTYMAGRAAEMLVFESATSGAANDIEHATNIATAMIARFGMSEKFGMMCLASTENKYLDYQASYNVAGATRAELDKEVLKLINQCYADAMQMLVDNRECLDKISEHLYEHETITGKEFMKIFRQIKGIPEPEEENDKKSFMEQALEAEGKLTVSEMKEASENVSQTVDLLVTDETSTSKDLAVEEVQNEKNSSENAQLEKSESEETEEA